MRSAVAALLVLLAGCEVSSYFELDVAAPPDLRDPTRLHAERHELNGFSKGTPCTSFDDNWRPPKRIDTLGAGFRIVYPTARIQSACFRVWYDVDGDGALGPGDRSWHTETAVDAVCRTWLSADRNTIVVDLR